MACCNLLLLSCTVLLCTASSIFTAGSRAATLFVAPNQHTCGSRNPCYQTVRYAVGDSNDGDTIQLLSGTYTDTMVDVDKAVSITGAGFNATFDCQLAPGPVFRLTAAANISSLTIQNCSSFQEDNTPSALLLDSLAQTAVVDVTIEACESIAITVTSSSRASFLNLRVSNSQPPLMRCRPALFVAPDATVVLKDASFTANQGFHRLAVSGYYCGGAMMSDGASIECHRCNFRKNTANQGGAVCALAGKQVYFDQSTFDQNSAKLNGGAFYGQDVHSLTINRSSFSQNAASELMGQGGAMAIKSQRGYSILNSNFTANIASFGSSALWTYGTKMNKEAQIAEFDHCIFENNLILNTSIPKDVPAYITGFAVQVQSFTFNAIFRNVHFRDNHGGDISLTQYAISASQTSLYSIGLTLESCQFTRSREVESRLCYSMLLVQGPFTPLVSSTMFAGYTCVMPPEDMVSAMIFSGSNAVTLQGPLAQPTFNSCR